jgi:flagellin
VQKNSLESNIRSLRVSQEELTAAESVLRDADMAQEISELTRNQIMMQSGIAMLGQANQMPRNVLSLLQGI